MSNRDDSNWVPLAAGIVVGVGVLSLLYKMFYTGPQRKIYNQQINVPYVCTCKNGDNNPCQLHKKIC